MWEWKHQMWETNKGTIERDKRIVKCDVGTAQCEDENHQMWEKSKRTTQREKRTVTSDVGIAQYEDGTVKCKKKVRELSNLTKELSYMMLELHNVRMKSSSVRKR